MLSHSGVVKLKAALIVDLFIVCAVTGAYFYLQYQGVISNTAIPPTFVLADLRVNPMETFVGQPIQISVNVTNIGEIEGDTTVNLEVNGVVRDSVNILLAGLNSSEIVYFTIVEMDCGNYTVKIGGLSSFFMLGEAPPEVSKIIITDFKADPYEVWPNEPITISAAVVNRASKADNLLITVTVDGVLFENRFVEVKASDTLRVEFKIVTSEEGLHTVELNTLKGTFSVVPRGYHTLIITRTGGGSAALPFTLNGETFRTSFTAILPEGQYNVTVPDPYDAGTGVLEFLNWNDGSTSPSLTFTLDKRTNVIASYYLIGGYASCPSLYIWNGTGYSYVTDVSNAGWLGYIDHIDSKGEITFSGGNPYDYVKLDKNVLTTKNGYFDITLSQQWDELYYLDSASLIVVDHPVGTDVYTSMTNYLNKGSTGQIYTTTTDTLLAPVSAVNEKGQDVLEAILWQDGNFTPGINGNANPAWNNISQNQLTLNLGDLSEASQIKLVITGIVDWGSADVYYNWIDQFKNASVAGLITEDTPITPASNMEILTADGTWVAVPQNRQIPLPSDYNARTFTVDLSGLFPEGTTNYVVRFTNFWNVTYDYIGIDTTIQQDITITTLNPVSAVLNQLWETNSKSSGAFTRYGDVTALIQNTDDMFVIGRQGDQVNMQFSIENLPTPADGIERDYFFVVACWFKDPPGEWGYGYTFTVDPLPFLDMTGFPYTNAESYPYDTTHIAYIREYNTRTIF